MFHGLVLVDKPENLTSHDVVNRARRALATREVGHAGTLDPMASGLLVLLVGEATKISDHVLNGDKAYRLRVRLGERTDTLDRTGQVLSQSEVNVSEEQFRAAAQRLVGEFHWTVPAFSATKVNGQKLYAMARAEKSIELPSKKMKFWDLEVMEIAGRVLTGHIYCSKGSYIRRWASELGEQLGCGAVLDGLTRTICTPYRLEQAISLEALESLQPSDYPMHPAFVPLRLTLPGLRSLTVRGRDERLIHHGQISLDLERRLLPEKRQATSTQTAVSIKILSGDSGELLSLLEAQPNRGLKIRRVFKTLVEPTQNQ